MSHNYPVESDPTAARGSDAQNFATTTQPQETIEEAMVWSPCYVCFDSAGLRSYSSLIVVRLLMHEIWMWENEIADEDQAKAESVPLETELLPCHYFDFFYGVSHGGLVATLLGRLRLRVDDAADEYRDITQAVFRDRRLFSSALPLEHMKLLNYRRKDLRKAVHNTVKKHLIDRTECGGADQLFRHPSSARWPAESDAPKQAQTCVMVYGGQSVFSKQTLCTFKYGQDQRERLYDPFLRPGTFTDQLDWTICHVLVAAMATPGFFLPSRETTRTGTTTLFDASVAESNPTGDAASDYMFLCRRGGLPAPNLELPTNTKQSTSGNPALFLSIGNPRDPKVKGMGKSKLMSVCEVHTGRICTDQLLICWLDGTARGSCSRGCFLPLSSRGSNLCAFVPTDAT